MVDAEAGDRSRLDELEDKCVCGLEDVLVLLADSHEIANVEKAAVVKRGFAPVCELVVLLRERPFYVASVGAHPQRK